eukprot:TRINITY_DN3149_c0_g1_i3.p1 TRINITY_DN3149_c0_g1~~TRINITY_DN3149_c0_g1_i3.p1  ORF type:complete len:782 (+),score=144.11 TRINITY_DN3149_c0_g1_i3:43-2388(+)
MKKAEVEMQTSVVPFLDDIQKDAFSAPPVPLLKSESMAKPKLDVAFDLSEAPKPFVEPIMKQDHENENKIKDPNFEGEICHSIEEDDGESFHYRTLIFDHAYVEYQYQNYYWDHQKRKLKRASALLIVAFAFYAAALIYMTLDDPNNQSVMVFHLALAFFPMCIMALFGNNDFLPHHLALLLNCSVFVLFSVGAVLSVSLFYYSHVDHPIVYAGLFYITGSIMPNFYIPFIHSCASNAIIFGLYIAARHLSKSPFTDDISVPSIALLLCAGILNGANAFDEEFRMRLEFLYARKISLENEKLRKKVWNLEGSKPDVAIVGNVNIDLESPIEKAIVVLRDMIQRTNDHDAKNLQSVLDVILQHNSMLKPDLEKQLEDKENMDAEVINWLFYELARKEVATVTGFDDPAATTSISDKDDRRKSSSLSLLRELTTQQKSVIDSIFDKRDPWNWDVFELNVITQGRALQIVAVHLFRKHKFVSKFKIDEEKMINFFAAIEGGYGKKIPYHNNMHAADVLLSVEHLLTSEPFKSHISDIELFGALLAACVHDYNHPGLNNAFQINTMSTEALIYNDRSVLENYHIAASWKLLKCPQNDILSGITAAERKTVRKQIIDMVLSTDLAVHFDTLGDLKSKLMAANNHLNLTDPRTKEMMLKVILKVADIGHTARNRYLHNKWVDRIQVEFFNQGDEEKRCGVPVSPFMDREKTSISKSQVGFMSFVVLPLFESLNYSNKFEKLVEQVKENQKYWEQTLKEEEEEQRRSSAAPQNTQRKSEVNGGGRRGK